MKERLEQAVHLSDLYREQCINAEEEAGRIRDEISHNQTIFQTRTSKLVDKLELTTKVRFISNYLIFCVTISIFTAIRRIGKAAWVRNRRIQYGNTQAKRTV